MIKATKDWHDVLLGPASTALDALQILETSGLRIVLIVDETRRLLGVVTDGDIRRLILNGGAMNTPTTQIMNSQPLTGRPDESRETILARLQARRLHHIPMVDDVGRLVHLVTLDDLIAAPSRDNLVVLMAGGLGARLRPLTANCPKPMLKVGGRPILETIINQFLEYGFTRFAISVNYMAEMITSHFGDGSLWGADISYLREGKPLGTAGALSLLPERPTESFFVMNGDLLTKLNFSSLLSFHEERSSPLTMCVREHAYSMPYGVADVQGDKLVALQEKPTYRSLVNAGIYVCDPQSLDCVPRDQPFDMTNMIDALIRKDQQPRVFPIHEYWVDIGHHRDFNQAHDDFSEVFEE